MLTCVRCMEHYDPNYNSAKSCHIRIGTGSERPTLTAMSGSAHLVIRHGQQTDWKMPVSVGLFTIVEVSLQIEVKNTVALHHQR